MNLQRIYIYLIFLNFTGKIQIVHIICNNDRAGSPSHNRTTKKRRARLTPAGRIYQGHILREMSRQHVDRELPREHGRSYMRIGKIFRAGSADCNNSNHRPRRQQGEARYGFNRFIKLLLSRRMAGHFAGDRPPVESDLFCPSCVFRTICVEYARNEAGDEQNVERGGGKAGKMYGNRGTNYSRKLGTST